MTELQGGELFPTPDSVEADRQRDLTTGLLPSQLLREAVAQGREILSPQPIGDDQIQPASIDLRLGEVAYRVRASVREKLELLSMHRIDLTEGSVLEKDCVYIVALLALMLVGQTLDAAAWVRRLLPRSGPERWKRLRSVDPGRKLSTSFGILVVVKHGEKCAQRTWF